MKKIRTYKGFVIAYDKETASYQVFTKDEWAYGKGYRTAEWEGCTSLAEAMQWIDSY
jgi:hypothetical protein